MILMIEIIEFVSKVIQSHPSFNEFTVVKGFVSIDMVQDSSDVFYSVFIDVVFFGHGGEGSHGDQWADWLLFSVLANAGVDLFEALFVVA